MLRKAEKSSSAPMHPVKVLVTAFGAFPGMPSNPSSRLVAQLAKQHRARLARLGIELVTAELPVIFAQVPHDLAALLERTRPQAIIHVGVAGRRKLASVETRAVNRIGTLRPDAARTVSATARVLSAGPAQVAARWPAQRLAAAMNSMHPIARLSIDAGDYVCNQTLYLSLARTSGPVGFLHISRLRSRHRLRRTDGVARPSLAQLVTALAKAAVIVAREVRRQG